ncbi:hypothetical protein [Pyrococcus kukulkanii]|uniref:Uncharacterized protein n=1 Tax=Pyrococcus kukulkanii TaxID=1609559 RepID=A0ABV4T5T5_9EURY
MEKVPINVYNKEGGKVSRITNANGSTKEHFFLKPEPDPKLLDTKVVPNYLLKEYDYSYHTLTCSSDGTVIVSNPWRKIAVAGILDGYGHILVIKFSRKNENTLEEIVPAREAISVESKYQLLASVMIYPTEKIEGKFYREEYARFRELEISGNITAGKSTKHYLDDAVIRTLPLIVHDSATINTNFGTTEVRLARGKYYLVAPVRKKKIRKIKVREITQQDTEHV